MQLPQIGFIISLPDALPKPRSSTARPGRLLLAGYLSTSHLATPACPRLQGYFLCSCAHRHFQ